MSLALDIAFTYRRPRAIFERLLAQGAREDIVLRYLIIACILIFVAQSPYQSREAFMDPEIPLSARLYWSGFFWVFIMPIVLYIVAFIGGLILRVVTRHLKGYHMRLALFWSLLAATPATLFCGLVAAFIGAGTTLSICALVWVAIFVWFWTSGLVQAGQRTVTS